jgi:riboflavin kinase/FMN adenylyltransferase
VEFLHKVREEEKFTSVEKLVATITADVRNIRQWFLHNDR